MSGKIRISPISLALGALLLVPSVYGAQPAWDCKAGPDNAWECSNNGVPSSTEPVSKASESTQPATTQPAYAATSTAITENEDGAPSSTETVSEASESTQSATTQPAYAATSTAVTENKDGAPNGTEPVSEASESTQPAAIQPAYAATSTAVIENKDGIPGSTEPASEASESTQPATTTQPAYAAAATAATEYKVAAKPTWDCRAGPGNAWECSRGGVSSSTKQPAYAATSTAATGYKVAAKPTWDCRAGPGNAWECSRSAIAYNAPVIGGILQSSGSALRIDRDLNWNQCGPLNDPATNIIGRSNETQIEADSAQVSRENKQAIFSGKVVVTKGNQLLEADRVTYNNRDETVEAEGSVYYQSPGLLVSGSSAKMYLAENKGRLKNIEYRLPKRRARGSATLVDILGSEQSRFENISYTTCRPGNDDWVLEAGKLEINRETGVGVAHDTTFRFMGVPFFYLPYASFPIDDRRKTGVLVPSIGQSDETGTDISVPYYINIAPNMDATITPRIMSKRGLMVAGEFRHLTENYYSETKLELLPNDKERESHENSARGAFSYKGHGHLTPRLVLDANINYASDNDYLEDLGDSLAVSSSRYLERRGDLRYYGNNWNILGRAQYYQTMDETIARKDRPYARLPQIKFKYKQPDQFAGATLHLDAEYVYFDKDTDPADGEPSGGHRFDINPAISFPMRSSWGFFTPKLGVRHTSYNLKDQTAGMPDSPDRNTSTFSLDSGLFFERVGANTTSTLEPRMFYLYTPNENQDDLPIFDTAEYDFGFHNMFNENRFSGTDRVSDANQLTLALTSRTFSNDTGAESFRLSIGEIFYFSDREVQLPGVATIDDSSSAFVGEIAMQLSQNWSTQAGLEWDNNRDDNQTAQSSINLRYNNHDKTLFNVGYRYARDIFEQSDISFRFPITSHLNAVGRWDYSLRHDKTMESFAGVEYSNCCWALRAVGRRYINDTEGDANTAFYLQLELKGLTNIGDKVGGFLEESVLGYSKAK